MKQNIHSVAIVGCGLASGPHLSAWKTVQNCQITAVCDVNEELARRTASHHGISRHYSDLKTMLEDQDLSIVDICTPPQTHLQLIRDSLRAGAHVVTEKPLCMDVQEADEIMNELRSHRHPKLCVIHNWMYFPAIIRARSIVESGAIGEIIGMDLRVLCTSDDSMARNRHHWSHKLPGGRLAEMLPHPIYVLQSFLGDLTIDTVQLGKIGNYSWMPFDELRILLSSKGRSAQIYASFNSTRASWLIDVYGTEGIIKANLIGQSIVTLKRNGNSKVRIALDQISEAIQLTTGVVRTAINVALGRRASPYKLCIASFIENIERSRPLVVNSQMAHDGVGLLRNVCDEIEKEANKRYPTSTHDTLVKSISTNAHS